MKVRKAMLFERYLIHLGRLVGIVSDATRAGKRIDPRKQCLITSGFNHCGSVDSAQISALSGFGAFVETHRRFHVGEVVHLKFPLYDLDSPVEVTGVIAWTSAEGVQVRFNPARF